MTNHLSRRSVLACATGAALASTSTGRATATAASATSSTWRQQQADSRNTGTAEAIPQRLATDWSFEYGDPMIASPIVGHGSVYVGGDNRGVVSIDATSGEEEWRAPELGTIGATPALVGSTLFVQTFEGDLVAVDANDGTLGWRVETSPRPKAALVADGGTVVALSGHRLVSVDAEAGDVLWSHEFDNHVGNAPAMLNGAVFVDDGNGHLVRFDDDGPEEWRTELVGPIRHAPTATSDHVFIGSGATAGRLFALDTDTGAVSWTADFEGQLTPSPAVDDGRIYVFARRESGSTLTCLDADAGTEQWSTDIDHQVDVSPVVDGTTLLASTVSGKLVSLDADTGDVRATEGVTDEGRLSAPAVADGTVYVTSTNGGVNALSASESAVDVPGFGPLAALGGLGGYALIKQFQSDETS
ncbi:PQQ-binding-like beta-propeller repeat protein [Haloparvum sp. PAK95]|uniref:outer membrane protein assembly factor BamB family protein n=1 Tax=Haloparvum sp. PAK95 TaxID=3418962 RepID=UPI003D2EE5A7